MQSGILIPPTCYIRNHAVEAQQKKGDQRDFVYLARAPLESQSEKQRAIGL